AGRLDEPEARLHVGDSPGVREIHAPVARADLDALLDARDTDVPEGPRPVGPPFDVGEADPGVGVGGGRVPADARPVDIAKPVDELCRAPDVQDHDLAVAGLYLPPAGDVGQLDRAEAVAHDGLAGHLFPDEGAVGGRGV